MIRATISPTMMDRIVSSGAAEVLVGLITLSCFPAKWRRRSSGIPNYQSAAEQSNDFGTFRAAAGRRKVGQSRERDKNCLLANRLPQLLAALLYLPAQFDNLFQISARFGCHLRIDH